MKKFLSIPVMMLAMGFCSTVHAQTRDTSIQHQVKTDLKAIGKETKSDVKHAEHTFKKGTRKAADKTSKGAAKGKAAIKDQIYKDKAGPNGETVFIDNHSRYYWIDEKGNKHYTKKEALKDKTE